MPIMTKANPPAPKIEYMIRDPHCREIAGHVISEGQKTIYLTEVEATQWQSALERFLAGNFRVEERTTLDVELHRDGVTGGQPLVHHQAALNDAVVEKLRAGRTVRVGVSIDGRPFLSFATDGLIGCPHEEGIDYPEGKSCPQCPYWAGRDRFTRERIH